MGKTGMVLLLVALVAACEQRTDVAPAQPADGTTPGTQPVDAQAGTSSDTLEVQLQDANGQAVGVAHLIQQDDGVAVHIRVSGLTPNREHGFHVHQTGQCEGPGFQSAGGHLAPYGRQHGFENPEGPHAGDLPNLRADAQGVADTSFVAQQLQLRAGRDESIIRPGGVALMIHADPDDYRTDPSGNSGDRIICGVARPQ